MQVVVVGGGVIGCAVAHELARRGADVRVLDARQPGDGASRASAGILAPYIEGHSPGLLRLGVQSLAMYDAFVERARTDSGLPVEYRRTGTLEVALDEEQAGELRTTAARHAAAGVGHRYLDAAEARSLEPAVGPATTGALLVPDHGYVQVRALILALETAARRMGVVFTPAAPVQTLETRDGRIDIVLPGQSVQADAVVLSAGTWSGQVAVAQTVAVPVTPIRGQLLELGCRVPPASRVVWGPDCYLVPWQDGTVLLGATVEDVGFDERATVIGVRQLLDAAEAVLPATRAAAFHDVRVGLRPATRDELPVIGRSVALPNVVYATGHYRNGVLLAPLTAVAVADLVLEGREAPALSLTPPGRFGL